MRFTLVDPEQRLIVFDTYARSPLEAARLMTASDGLVGGVSGQEYEYCQHARLPPCIKGLLAYAVPRGFPTHITNVLYDRVVREGVHAATLVQVRAYDDDEDKSVALDAFAAWLDSMSPMAAPSVEKALRFYESFTGATGSLARAHYLELVAENIALFAKIVLPRAS